MDASGETQVPTIQMDFVRPYISLTILEITSDDPGSEFSKLIKRLRERSLTGRDGVRMIVSDGMDQAFFDGEDSRWLAEDPYQADAFVLRCDQAPPWMKSDSVYVDTTHKLVVAFRRHRLVGIHTDHASLREAIQTWLDRSPRPQFRRVAPGVLHAAFLRGEAKGLWLRGTHARRATKADTKTLSGQRLQDALLPHEDSSFAMGSARATLPTDLGLEALSGAVGTTPRKSQIWGAPTDGILDFFAQADEALMLVEDALSAGLSVDQPFPLLATKEEELLEVRGAFDISVLDPEDLRSGTSASDELVEAATLLQGAIFDIEGRPNSPSFVLAVGLNGAICGNLRGSLVQERGIVKFRFGYYGEPTYGHPVRLILDALNDHADDLLTVYYESGHTVVEGSLWKREIRVSPFPNWQFRDFSHFDITSEKPQTSGTQRIHDSIGLVGDSSLFSWVVQQYADGWLICDDGSGEVADFLHIARDERSTLSLIHVKGASNGNPQRRVAVGPYEVVASQAAKNIRYLSPDALFTRLSEASIERPACWTDGQRVNGRGEFLEQLARRKARDEARVVIVQPHVSEHLYNRVHSEKANLEDELHNTLRMSLLEALLNTARASVVGLGADLYVIGSKR